MERAITWCENADPEDYCGHCTPCKTMKFNDLGDYLFRQAEVKGEVVKGDFARPEDDKIHLQRAVN